MSSLMMCQHFFKKRSLNPSGPGALSRGILFTTLVVFFCKGDVDLLKIMLPDKFLKVEVNLGVDCAVKPFP
jgi:hypothetical protein